MYYLFSMLDENTYIGLLFSCPANNEQEDCPLKEQRKLSTEDKYLYWIKLSHEEKIALINHHKCCLKKNGDTHISK